MLDIPHSYLAEPTSSMSNLGLDTWFARPRLLATVSQAEGANVTGEWAPWKLFFTLLDVYNKLSGFSAMRAQLHIKIVVNASPFRYGLSILSYQPMVSTATVSTTPLRFSGGSLDAAVLPTTDPGKMALWQRPHVLISPGNGEGAEMHLPFLWNEDYVSLLPGPVDTSLNERLEDLGTLTLSSVTPLATSTTASSVPITYSVYAWATDVELIGPSMMLQGADEYSATPVSSTATAVSKAAMMLGMVPYIGPYARATSVAAGTMADVARLFGYSNPPVISPVSAMRATVMPNLASPDISTQMEKMTMDPKNELTIDPCVTGACSGDPLTVASYAGREAYITKATWQMSDAPSTVLLSGFVTPEHHWCSSIRTSGTTPPYQYFAVQMTPAAHLCQMFSYWRGSMVYKFSIVASRFHRGRLKFTYDPAGPYSLTGVYATEGQVFTQIVDISDASSFEVEIPYCQKTTWLNLKHDPALSYETLVAVRNKLPTATYLPSTTAPLTRGMCGYNGYWRIEVLNDLCTATVDADVTIVMTARAGADFEVAGPCDNEIQTWTPFEPLNLQGGDEVESAVEDDVRIVVPEKLTPVNMMHTVYMGEVVRSVRPLMHRMVRYNIFNYLAAASLPTTQSLLTWVVPRLPYYPGPGNTGGWLHQVSTGARYNYVAMSPLNWFLPAFVGYRGSVVWRAMGSVGRTENQCDIASLSIMRSTLALTGGNPTVVSLDKNTSYVNAYYQLYIPPGLAGQAVTNANVSPGIDAVMPMYSRFKMLSANPNFLDGATPFMEPDDRVQINMEIAVSGSFADRAARAAVHTFVGAGVDFNPISFLNVPTMYRFNSGISVRPI